MKKTFRFVGLMLIAVMSFSFTACGGSDDEPSVRDQLVGIWKTTMSSSNWKLIELKSDGSIEYYLYIENGTVKYEKDNPLGLSSTANTHWIYNENDKTIRMYTDDNYYNYIYVVSMNKDGDSWNGSVPSTGKIYSFERVKLTN